MGRPKGADPRHGHLCETFLREGVHFAAVGPDIVILDRASDSYSCLPDAGEVLQITSNRLSAPEAWVEALAEAGLTSERLFSAGLAPPDHPARDLSGRRMRKLPTDIIALFRAGLAGWRHGATAPVDVLTRSLPPLPGGPIDLDRIAAVVAGFQRISPWLPRQGACLYRASVLLHALRYAGQDATWVFGVRTWPFSAHCWLQVGDAVLDDDPERVALYTPIMAV